MTTINDKWIDFAIRLQSIAQAGLQYGKDKYDIERYEEIRRIAAEMISAKTGLGYIVNLGSNSADIALVVIGIIVIAVIGALLSAVLTRVERWLCPWKEE